MWRRLAPLLFLNNPCGPVTLPVSTPSAPALLPSLDLLRVEKAGALGIPLDDLATRVAAVEAHAAEVLLGVAVEGALAAL